MSTRLPNRYIHVHPCMHIKPKAHQNSLLFTWLASSPGLPRLFVSLIPRLYRVQTEPGNKASFLSPFHRFYVRTHYEKPGDKAIILCDVVFVHCDLRNFSNIGGYYNVLAYRPGSQFHLSQSPLVADAHDSSRGPPAPPPPPPKVHSALGGCVWL